jgi:hypothetical protein
MLVSPLEERLVKEIEKVHSIKVKKSDELVVLDSE